MPLTSATSENNSAIPTAMPSTVNIVLVFLDNKSLKDMLISHVKSTIAYILVV
ncbi:MAG: hypothetical protein QXD40_01490 [Desulfurococcaceae archaeon]